MDFHFVTDEAAALLPGKVLVVTDIHIGYEYEMRRAGIRIPSQTEKLIERLRHAVNSTGARKMIILGDVKHRVPGMSFQEEREVPHMLNTISSEVDVEIVPGNHDDGLEKLVPNIRFHPSSGVRMGDSYLMHGHTWPEKSFLKSDHVFMGHNHPVIEFRDGLGYVWREQVWVRAALRKAPIEKRYGGSKSVPDIIVMPSYSYSGGGRSLNGKERSSRLMGPIGRIAKTRSSKIYMLDGTYLGELGKL